MAGGSRAASAAIWIAPILALAIYSLVPEGALPPAAIATAAIAIWMAAWWMTEALPLAVTALLPLVLFPLLGVSGFRATATSYADPLIFLFFGGFLLARTMQRWHLTRHLARFILGYAGNSPAGIIAGVMVATAFLSMWVSNTATAMMMMPIGQSIVKARQWDGAGPARRDCAGALMLGIAYAATIGGMGTLIGTPPNALFAAFIRDAHGIEVGFAQWMLVGVPAVLLLLPVAWLVLTRVTFRVPSDNHGPVVPERLEPMGTGARRTAIILLMAAAGLIFRPVLELALPGLGLSDAGIVLTAALAMFLIPSGESDGARLLTWNEVHEIRWDVLLLFGGGLALAEAISSTGLAGWLGNLVTGLRALPFLAVLMLTATIILAVGELASNTAMASIFLPVASAMAVSLGAEPIQLVLLVALTASLGFMLPVATPPNAIVYGSGALSANDMLRAGLLMNLAGLVVMTFLSVTLGRWVFPAI